MKKALTTIAASATYLSLALPAFAQSKIDPCPKSGFSALCKIKAENLGTVIQNVVVILLIIAVVVAMFYLVFGGIRWVTSGGDKVKVQSARDHIIAAIVGLVVAFLAYFILTIILQIFGLKIGGITLPTLGS